MNRTNRFIKNTATALLLQAATIVSGFLVPITLIKAYGSEVNGLIASLMQFISYFTLVEAGLLNAGIYALYEPLSKKDTGRINSILSAAKKMFTSSGGVFALLVASLALVYPLLVKITAVSHGETAIIALSLGVSQGVDFFLLSKYHILLNADQRTYMVNIAAVTAVLANAAVIVLLSSAGVGVAAMRDAAACSVLLRVAVLLFFVRRHYKYVDFSAKPDKAPLSRRWDAFFLQILNLIYTGSPIIIATVFLDLDQVSVFSIYFLIVNGINTFTGTITGALTSPFGDIISRGEKDTLKQAYRDYEFAYYGMTSVLFGLAFVLLMPFIKIYTSSVTDVSYNLPEVGILLLVFGLVFNLRAPQNMLVVSSGMFRETRTQTIVQGALAVVLSVAGALLFGLPGLAAGRIISNVYRLADLIYFVPKHITGLPRSGTLVRLLASAVTVALIVLPFALIDLSPAGYLQWLVQAVAAGIYAVAVALAVALVFQRAPLFSLLKRGLAFIKRKK